MLNLASLKTPGVYVDEVPKFPPSVAQVETAIPAFIGYTQKAQKDTADDLLSVPTRIRSLAEYVELFGEAPAQNYTVTVSVTLSGPTPVLYEPVSVVRGNTLTNFRMYHAVRLFYANGGGPCYIVSVGNYSSTISATALGNNSGTGGLDLVSKVDEVTMLLFPDANGIPATEPPPPDVNPDAGYYNLFNQALQQCAEQSRMDRVALIDVKDGAINPVIGRARNGIASNEALKYGAAYYPWLHTVYTHHRTPGSIILSLPDSDDPDPDPDTITLANATLDASIHKKFITSGFLATMNKLMDREKVIMPPTPAIAGIYAKVDSTRGVWKAPANVGVIDIVAPTVAISDEDQKDLNITDTGKSVNAIRSFVGRGTVVWGARTLAGNDNEWKYVSVRRFFNMVEESTKKASAQFVFEPNDANTWVKVQAMVENYLNTLWRVGALQGAKPEHAFYVAVGLNKTMTPDDILNGRMIVEIGMAVVRPAEFIVLRFSHKMAES